MHGFKKRRKRTNYRDRNRKSLNSSATKKKQHYRWILKLICFALVSLTIICSRDTVTIQPAVNLKGDSGISQAKADTFLESDSITSFDSKRKLVHVINPYVDVRKIPSHEAIQGSLASLDDGIAQSDFITPVSMEQFTVLASIRRARNIFRQYLASQRRFSEEMNVRPNTTDDEAPASSQALSDPTMEHFAFGRIELVCAVLPEDMSTLKSILPGICDRTVLLSRSTRSQYGANRSLPFLQDILESGKEYQRADNSTIQSQQKKDENFYLFSNADIGLSKNFYMHLERQMMERQASALSINRMTLSVKTTVDSTAQTSSKSDSAFDTSGYGARDTMKIPWDSASRYLEQVDDLIAANQFQSHPGYDCFLFHSSVLKRIHFGDFFVGFPPFGANVHLALLIMAPNYVNLASNPNGTFHLGNDRNWKTPDSKKKVAETSSGISSESKQQSIAESYDFWTKFREDLYYLQWCPISNHPPPNEYAMQNSINCGKWFRPNRKWPLRNQKSVSWWPPWWPNTHSLPIPAFVREGSEAIYLRNYAMYLKYTKAGMPLVTGHQTPEIKRRLPKIVKERKGRLEEDSLLDFVFNKILQTIESFSK